MGDLNKAIRKFILDEIKLFQKDISEAVKSREWFLKRIKNKIDERTNEPVLYSEEPFVYFGSYFKKTKVKDVDEFDILVVIDSNTGVFSRGNSQIGKGVGSANPNYKYDKKYYKSDQSGVSPSKLLNWLKGIVEEIVESYGGEAPIRDGQAITAIIKSKGIKIDLVPAGIFKKDDGTIFYNIPKGDKNNDWILTQPKDDMELLKNVAKDKEDFRNIIRLTKYIRSTYNFKISSFAIESAIVQYGQEKIWKNDLYNDLLGVLSYLANKLNEGIIKDPFDSTNLIQGVENKSWYAERIERIIEKLKSLEEIEDQEKVEEKVSKIFRNEL